MECVQELREVRGAVFCQARVDQGPPLGGNKYSWSYDTKFQKIYSRNPQETRMLQHPKVWHMGCEGPEGTVEPMAPTLMSEKITFAFACFDSTSLGTPEVMSQVPRLEPGWEPSVG